MRYFPAFHDLSIRPSLVVGGGEAAARKLRLLMKAGARAVVVAPAAGAEIAGLAAAERLTWHARPFTAADIAGCGLVITATGRADVDAAVSEAAQSAGVPVNVVDRPELSTFITPAIIDRDPLVIGISSGADAPILARQIRARLESLLPANLGRLARFAGAFRGAVAAQIADGPGAAGSGSASLPGRWPTRSWPATRSLPGRRCWA
jgi:uroporphyrin-III C-methyltransferase / precorrin-2 dehydrogenase / sirohydrochlorin ferrochelatase